jgi:DUF917 family protein
MIFGSFYPMSGRQVKQLTVHDTVTHTLEIGRRIRAARESQLDPVKGVLRFLDAPDEGRYARELFNGRITDVLHETRDGWHWGRVLISSGAGVEPECLKVFGPRLFGIDEDFRPVEELVAAP